jgi:hypothetical protein
MDVDDGASGAVRLGVCLMHTSGRIALDVDDDDDDDDDETVMLLTMASGNVSLSGTRLAKTRLVSLDFDVSVVPNTIQSSL